MPWEVSVWLVPITVAVVGIYRPRWGVLVFAASLPFFGSPPGGPYLAAFDVAALAVVATSLRASSPPRSLLALPLLVFATVGLASLLPAVYSPPSWGTQSLLRLASTLHGVESWTALYTWRAALDLLLGVGVFHALRRSRWRRDVAPLGVAIGLGLAVTAIFGLLEHLELVGLGAYRAVGQYVPPERMHSVFFNSGWLAEYFVVGAPFAVAALLTTARRRSAAILVALSLSVILLTQQRGAWIAALTQLGLLAVATGRRLLQDRGFRRRLVATTGLLAALMATLVVVAPTPRSDALHARLSRPFSDLAGREALWQASLEMAPQRPLLGWGLGSFAPVYDAFHPPGSAQAQRPRGTAHNWYLNMLVETGVLGLAAFGLLVAVAVLGVRRQRQAQESCQRMLAIGLSVSLAGALVYGLVQHMPFLRSVHWLLWILLAATACGPSSRTPEWIRPAALAIVAVTLVWLPFRWLSPSPALRGDHAYGFREPALSENHPFQWTGSRAARRVAWTQDCLQVRLANGHPSPQHEVEVSIQAASRQVKVKPGRSWANEILQIGPPSSPHVVVHITAKPTFRPFQDLPRHDLPASRDIRLLGVAVGDIESIPCSSEDTQPG